MSAEPTVYAFYDGGELVAVGTAKHLAGLLGCTPQCIYWYASPRSRQRHAVPVTKEQADVLGTRIHFEAMVKICARIVRVTRGRCRDSSAGCDWLGWCEPCYRGACQLVADRKKEASNGR